MAGAGEGEGVQGPRPQSGQERSWTARVLSVQVMAAGEVRQARQAGAARALQARCPRCVCPELSELSSGS
jgi:hypothetical protein